ncbi:hypothetical protein D3C72_1867480 [compost metagenome]
MAVQQVALAQGLQHGAAHAFGLHGRLMGSGAESFQQQHKFIAPQARNRVARAHTASQPGRHLPQQLVANLMALGVV